MVYTFRFFFLSSKCSLFNNSNEFGSSIIHILYTGCAKIKKIIPALKAYLKSVYSYRSNVIQYNTIQYNTVSRITKENVNLIIQGDYFNLGQY